MAYSYAELRSKTDDELIEFHDEKAVRTEVGVAYVLDELRRREASRDAQLMIRYTNEVRRLTWAIAGFTAINVIVAVILVLDALRD